MGGPTKPESEKWRLNSNSVIRHIRYRLRALRRDMEHYDNPRAKGKLVSDFLEELEELVTGKHGDLK